MPTGSQQTILDSFQAAAGSPAARGNVADLIGPLTQATQAINAQTGATGVNTDALGQNTAVRGSSSGGGGAAGVFNTVSQFLGGGLSLIPLVSLFAGLFGGGPSAPPPPPVPYALPPALHMELSSNYQDVIFGENGLPRAVPDTSPNNAAANAAPQITVQVQAIDSQSFLDHSDEIAQAVRQAMLNMHAINDVVADL